MRVALAVAKLRWLSPKINIMRCAAVAKLRWPWPKIKDARCAGRRQVALAVAKDKRYAFTQFFITSV